MANNVITKSGGQTKVKRKVTVNGITVTLDSDTMDDVEFVETLRAMQRGENDLLVLDIIQMMLGEKQYLHVREKLKDPLTGKCRMSALNEFIEEVFAKLPK